MEINQVFESLRKAGGIRAARVIVENTKNFSKIKLWFFCRQLRKGVPVAKIIHQKWFYGLKFYTNTHTLDPRPDTETLVSAVISDCSENKKIRILDIGTGTACIISALVKNIYGATGVGIDKSWRAIRVAKKNIKSLGISDKIKILHKDFYKMSGLSQSFDIIVSNPPYIAKNDKRVNDGAHYDPDIALYAKDNGMAAYEAIAKNAKNWIKHGGKIYLEIGIDMGRAVKQIFESESWQFVRSEKDLAGIERVLVFQK